jgi:hypothetical protein
VGVVLLVLAVRARAAWSGRPRARARHHGVVLVALARSLVLGDRVAGTTDPDALNLVATVVVLVAVVVCLARRRLTPERALAFAGVLTLSALVAHRTLLADPARACCSGSPGRRCCWSGLTWDLLTGAGWGNGSSRRFPRPTRVLLVLTNSLLTMTVLAYAALSATAARRLPGPLRQFGDSVLGTGLLAAAVVAVLDAAWRGRPWPEPAQGRCGTRAATASLRRDPRRICRCCLVE